MLIVGGLFYFGMDGTHAYDIYDAFHRDNLKALSRPVCRYMRKLALINMYSQSAMEIHI